MRRLRLSRAAHRDLIDIAEFTRDRWGDAQVARYLGQLDATLRSLAREPEQGRACDDVRPGLWRCREGRHVVFYRLGAKSLDVVRVLHERMLPRRHV